MLFYTLPSDNTRGGGGTRDVMLENFSLGNGGKELIVDATVMLAFGRRYGLIGRNGTGKTTLLRALAAMEVKGIPPTCQVLHVEQEVAGDDTPVVEAVLACDPERTQLLQEEADLLRILSKEPPESSDGGPAGGPDGAVPSAGEEGKARAAAAVAAAAGGGAVASGAGSAAGADEAAMAARLVVVYQRLQEIDAYVLWLEDYLVRWPKTLLVVSHAREFLNVVATDILHLHSQKIVTYKGNYSLFERTMTERLRNAKKAAEAQDTKRKHVQQFIDRFRLFERTMTERLRNAKKAAEAQDTKRKHVQQFIDRFRFNANRAALVQSRIKALERMSEVELMEEGPNGIGKSTLLNLISGKLQPTVGTITRNTRVGVRLATFSQHHVDGLDLSLTPLQIMARTFPDIKEPELRGHLSSFGVPATLAGQAMYTLSGGQKSRVAFAKMTFTKPHILLLDEPSNHLDIDAVNALIQGLATFKGGVLMVSHDQFLIESTVDELWMCEEGFVSPFRGTFDEYKSRLRGHAVGTKM
ncbi:ABC transporter F family member 3 [Tetrabaena socialis]|uniref:ABC transporter F family member 3 n=1 Tax=Tetrabaena socialis TaxID=47790 RepID=A0A2J7ZLU2_9CHLO|nr:ABC transporter F family member 3 [Tetrabaena socialis]|eukprot:PNH01238.1 ABC transporter F family member 3 [Tetrabaena socialis]